LLLIVALKAAGTFSGERERDTFDCLLVTPMTDWEILGAKAWASILRTRYAWWGLGITWSLGAVTGGLSPGAAFLLVTAWCIYSAFFALTGIWLSLINRSSFRAMVWVLLIALGVSLGPWLLNLGVEVFLAPGFVLKEYLYGFSPPWVLVVLAYSRAGGHDDGLGRTLLAALFGLLCYAMTVFCLWRWLTNRFASMAGRVRSK
jgi:ABC-type transport system involved in multi-copper enzyme maturation permease subunit